MRATTAPSTAAVVTTITVHDMLVLAESLANAAVQELNFGPFACPMNLHGEAVVACSTSASALNVYTVLARMRG